MEPPKIMQRICGERAPQQLQELLDQLNKKVFETAEQIESTREKMMYSRCFDSEYWANAVHVAEKEMEWVDTHEEIAAVEFVQAGGNPDEWEDQNEYKGFRSRRETLKDTIALYEEQVLRLSQSFSTSVEKAFKCFDVSDFLARNAYTSSEAFSATAGSDRAQSSFRQVVYDAYHHVPDQEYLVWDVVSGARVFYQDLTPYQFFAPQNGEDTLMDDFGPQAEHDLESPSNGLLLPRYVEEHLEDGIFTIYPDFHDNASLEERVAWHASEPKEYRFRFFEVPERPKHPHDELPLYFTKFSEEMTYSQLDGQRLHFQGAARPEPCYIYFHYLRNLSRYAWRNTTIASYVLELELGKPFWGIPGAAYMRKDQIESFIKQIDHACSTR